MQTDRSSLIGGGHKLVSQTMLQQEIPLAVSDQEGRKGTAEGRAVQTQKKKEGFPSLP